MAGANPTSPPIPNHEMLRVIGRGSYGEIWLARSITGALRAVKIVYRATFESERSFNREFDGMARFEPISRAHNGFIDILDVGRDDAHTFFYYVMELADDVDLANRDPAAYQPHTLALEAAQHQPLAISECVKIGLAVSEALAVLHQHGLAHRDIKPSNIILADGKPKIADIGLVASSGQRSFVGTEGYVPPEGPGTAQADIYSLGKVLYEISSGKDRFDFPEFATRWSDSPGKSQIAEFNEILLAACAGNLKKRFESAEEMHEALARVRDGLPPLRKKRCGWILLILFVALTVSGLAAWFAISEFSRSHSHQEADSANVQGTSDKPAQIIVRTEPPGAMVILGDRMKRSPAKFTHVDPGRYHLRVMLSGYEPVKSQIVLGAGAHASPTPFRLTRSLGSLEITSHPTSAKWELNGPDHLQRSGTAPSILENLPTGHYEIIAHENDWQMHTQAEVQSGKPAKTRLEFATATISITSQPPGASILIDQKNSGKTPLKTKLLIGKHEISARFETWPLQSKQIIISDTEHAALAFAFHSGRVKIISSPDGATVFANGEVTGKTPLLLENVKPGKARYEVRLTGFKNAVVQGVVKPDEQLFLPVRFQKRAFPVAGEPWENSLGMKFVSVGSVLFSIWDTRNKDYAAFCKATGRPPLNATNGDNPVVKVNWQDAMDFCQWLTKKERAAGLLDDDQSYRLPTDLEWSRAAGLKNEKGATPQARDGNIKGVFPWGKTWPPTARSGNYADQSARKNLKKVIANDDDEFPQVSPVGSFPPNAAGLYDMGGNVWQWVLDNYKGSAARHSDWGVLRGGSWANAKRADLETAYRNVVDKNERDVIFGFRCVLVPNGSQ